MNGRATRVAFTVFLSSFVFLTAGLPATAQDAEQVPAPTAEDLVARFVEANGGLDAGETLKTRRLDGTITLAAVGTPWKFTAVQKAPDRSHTRTEIPGYGAITEGCDGQSAWRREPSQGIRPLQGWELQSKIRDARFDGIVELLTEADVSYAGRDTVDGEAFYVLRAVYPGDGPWSGASYTAYIDPDTYLLHMLKVVPDGMPGLESVVRVGDHRSVDGVRIPFSMTVSLGQNPVMTVRLDRVGHGIEVDDALFDMPTRDLEGVDYAPGPDDDWEVSTPAAQGLDPDLVAELYLDAAELETLYGLLVVKNGRLVAEGYFHEGAVDQVSGRQSVTKSYTSALVGVALDRGCLSSVDQRMMEFFPELAGQLDDPRKEEITIRQLLQMRAGYPWEEKEPPWFDRLFLSDDWRWVPHVADFPLSSDPGAAFRYSNLTSHILAVIVARACDTDVAPFGQAHLFSPIGAELAAWSRDADGYNFGSFEISVTARDMAKFGLLYLNGGAWDGSPVVPADWVRESLQPYSRRIFDNRMTRYFREVGYGYQWWSARVGEHSIDFAWGHGGNLIVLVPGLDMILVTTADPLHHLPGEEGWVHERPILDVVGKFIASLPAE